MICKQIIVSGRVQGVGFRNFTQVVAIEMGIIGWARNLFSGQVEILASHQSKEVMDEFVKRVHEGPSRSKVDSIEIFDINFVTIANDNFEITSDGASKSEF